MRGGTCIRRTLGGSAVFVRSNPTLTVACSCKRRALGGSATFGRPLADVEAIATPPTPPGGLPGTLPPPPASAPPPLNSMLDGDLLWRFATGLSRPGQREVAAKGGALQAVTRAGAGVGADDVALTVLSDLRRLKSAIVL